MSKPAHVHIVVSGTNIGGEVFAFGWDYLGEAGNQTTLDGYTAAIAAIFTTTSATQTTLRSLLTSGGAYTLVTAYSYAAGAATASLVSRVPINQVGAGSNALPLQVSLVATLRTAIPSRRTRGRMFLPATGVTLSTSTGQLSTPSAANVAAAVKVLLGALGGSVIPVVISSAGTLGTPISAVAIDTKLDIQRRRANKQVATTTAVVTYP